MQLMKIMGSSSRLMGWKNNDNPVSKSSGRGRGVERRIPFTRLLLSPCGSGRDNPQLERLRLMSGFSFSSHFRAGSFGSGEANHLILINRVFGEEKSLFWLIHTVLL